MYLQTHIQGGETGRLRNRLAVGNRTGIRDDSWILVLPTDGQGCYYMGEELERRLNGGAEERLRGLSVPCKC